jgi:hypothetical protein
MYKQGLSLVNGSTAVRFHLIYDIFNTKVEEAMSKQWLSNANESVRGEYLELFADAKCTDVISGDMSGSLTTFWEAVGMKKHLLIGGQWGDNWGAFSTPIPNQTVN